MFRRLAPVLVLPFLFACTEDPATLPGKTAEFTLQTGTSFGMCVGYCWEELVVADGAVTYTRRAWRTDGDPIPDLTYTTTLPDAEWEALRSLAGPRLLEDVPEVVGCPDCADGGAEWVAIADGKSTDEVQFEYGQDLSALGDLLPRLRDLRVRIRQESGI